LTGVNVVKRSTAAAGANTDTAIITPAAGQKVKILAFWVNNEVAAQAAGMNFELRFGAQILALAGFMVAAAPIGQQTPVCICNAEIIGDGSTAINGRNLTALAATTIAAYTLVLEIS